MNEQYHINTNLKFDSDKIMYTIGYVFVINSVHTYSVAI